MFSCFSVFLMYSYITLTGITHVTLSKTHGITEEFSKSPITMKLCPGLPMSPQVSREMLHTLCINYPFSSNILKIVKLCQFDTKIVHGNIT